MSKYKKITIIICLSIFTLILCSVLLNKTASIDTFFYNLIISIKSDITTNIFKFITSLCGFISITIIVLITFFIDKKKAIYLLFSILFASLFNLILKNIICRHRPIDINIIVEKGYSFPSGHSITSIANFGLIIYYIYISSISSKMKKIFIPIVFIVMCMIPISRVYLGVHFFTDVVAGACLGTIWLMIYTTYLNKKLNMNK